MRIRRLLTLAVALLAVATEAGATADPAARADAPRCAYVQVAELPVRLVGNHVVTDGAINGRPVRVLLDTGSMQTLVLRSAAKRLDLTLRPTRAGRMYGVGGSSAVDTTLVDEFRVGAFVQRGLFMFVTGERDVGPDVLLGEDFFRQFDVEFDLEHDRVALYRPEHCEDVALAYWAGGRAGHVDFDPVVEGRPAIVVPVTVNGRTLDALFDTGASASMLDQREAQRLGVTPASPGTEPALASAGLGGAAIPSWLGRFDSIVVGDETIRDADLYFADMFRGARATRNGSRIPYRIPGLPSMLLGVDFLRAHRVLVAHSQRRIYFTYNGAPVFERAAAPGRATVQAPAAAGR